MSGEFGFGLTVEEGAYLLDLARLSVGRRFKGEYSEASLPEPVSDKLRAPLGAFVTLKKRGSLRGCIGRLVDEAPLYLTVSRMALAAAFQDPRFPPLEAGEFGELDWEVSVMGPITACREPEQVVIGRHGLIMKQGARQGLLLPQVPVEWGWGREEFLDQTCRKASLPAGLWRKAWKEDGVELYWFEAFVVHEGQKP
ncbi:AmmeMemoRadiSam system protein A [Desulfovibrio sp. OttesenSCG-928-C14]|nr:AmmeMemoRadiSam system protein A [Desulfovibrio sp. OttesenSCG-928-C14]